MSKQMKYYIRNCLRSLNYPVMLLSAGALMSFAGIATAEAQPTLLPTVNAVQTTNNPVISVTAGTQIGAQNSMNTSQKSRINVYNVTQVGPKSMAVVKQTGNYNNAAINQLSPALPIGW